VSFEPIAIVGQGCVLPGALSPQALRELVHAGRSAVGPVPAGRWGLRPSHAMGSPEHAADRTWSDAGGYVEGFDALFDPTGFLLPEATVRALDPAFRWVLHAAREALRPIGHERPSDRAGIILGNLSFPTAAMSRYAESVWLSAQDSSFQRSVGGRAAQSAGLDRPDARNRFMSGLPAHLAASALGLGAGAHALDAACASSLYAIKLACDRLHDRSADVMLAGAVNAADSLFIHVGFCALSAMSRTGQSRPFHRGADGLVPAEGAAILTLKRLSDALSAGDKVLGVIRGVGLSNDGRGRGLLAPAEEGQRRAMQLAYAMSGLSPSDVSLLECHATGTPVGDATEVRSTAALYEGLRDVPVGSLKSNLGHLITAAGAAGLMKVIGAMDAGVRPPTLHADAPLDVLSGSPFRLLTKSEPWPSDRPRVAGVSAFGFGGNNAHLLVSQEFVGLRTTSYASVPSRAKVAIVGIGAMLGDTTGASAAARAVLGSEPWSPRRESVSVSLEGLRFPPRDLEQTLPQQLMVLECAREAAAGVTLPRERTGVFVGMGADPEVARYGARWRLAEWSEAWGRSAGTTPSEGWLSKARDAVLPKLEAAGVVGTMPNIPANRINSQLDVAGPSFTVSAEEASGVVALEIAARALREGELDAALVGAVDLSDEPVHREALRELGLDVSPGDAAVVLLLKRLDDARRDGDRVLAVLDGEGTPTVRVGDGAVEVFARLRAHAATGLLNVAAAAWSVAHGAMPQASRVAAPWLGERVAEATTRSLGDGATTVRLSAGGEAAPLRLEAPPRLYVYGGRDRAAVLTALSEGVEGGVGPSRLVIVAATEDERLARAQQAKRHLEGGAPMPDGVAYRAAPLQGDTAAVFTGAAASYLGMGRELALAMPGAVANLRGRFASMQGATAWSFGETAEPGHPLDQLWASAFLCQLHSELVRDVFGLRPDATIGYSSGESNALFASGAWRDLDAMIRECWESPVFKDEIVGEQKAARRLWAKQGVGGTEWRTWSVAAPVAAVRAALEGESSAHLTIINAPDDCVIGGEAGACERVIERLGRSRAMPLGYAMAAHCPEIGEIRQAWYDIHRRETFVVPGVRHYSAGSATAFTAEPDVIARAITAQAVDTLDFPRMIERAWADGVRVFIEHGPRGLCSGWIKKVLGEREHLAVPMDVSGRSGVRQLANAAAALVAAGVAVDVEALHRALGADAQGKKATGATMKVPAHAPAIRLPAFETGVQVMAPAPRLVPVLGEERPAVMAAPVAAPAPVVVTVAEPRPVAAAPAAMVGATNDILARAMAEQGRVAAIHRGYLEAQATAHSRFLALQQTMLAGLLRARQSGGVGPQVETAGSPPAGVRALALTPATPAGGPTGHPGPRFDRAQLETLASGAISSVFGPAFASQDGYARQVRMPMPPLLLADRVTGIDAVPNSMGVGTLWTETDVTPESWYLHEGRMPAGIMIESGQADLLLISWLGIDRLNQGERVYRLLGCELTYHGELPQPGETLSYEIHVDAHAQQGDVRLFFFHYDCRVNGELRLSVRHGQAGFFTDEELANSGGILWDATTGEHSSTAQLDAPLVPCAKRSFSHDDLRAFAEGRVADCFGPGFEKARTHVRSPRISAGRMLFLHEVVDFDPTGGPWQRGYLRAEAPITADDWYFAGHFHNDPCMPGTLMFEGCLQAMSFYLVAMGFSVDRDGWRFEPVMGTKIPMRCRGQATPESRHLTYEIFIEEVIAGPVPTVYADLLCTVDGRKAFHARRVGLRLVPAWPLDDWARLPVVSGSDPAHRTMDLRRLGGLKGYVEPKAVAVVDGFAFDYASLIACAWGRPSAAFGPMYTRFDSTRGVARLPGPPYHFMSRITRADAPLGKLQPGGVIEAEYDIPPDAWYFDLNGHPTMPYCVLMEAALQPCGWLASYIGSALTTDVDLLFRNLDGTGTFYAEVLPTAGTLRTTVKVTDVSRSAGMIIESFEVECFVGKTLVYKMNTVFGFFPAEAFVNQVGLPVTPEDRARIESPSDVLIDLRARPAKYFEGSPRLPAPMLCMLDRITAWEPDGGKKGLGWARAEKDVRYDEWFFKAHFFQDPVQPGSLGIEALVQLLQFAMIERSMADGVSNPRFEPVAVGKPATWKYRGQVVPKNKRITTEIAILEVGNDGGVPFAVAEGSLWVDGKRIYHTRQLAMRIVPGGNGPLTALPRALTPAGRGQGLSGTDRFAVGPDAPKLISPTLTSQTSEPLPPPRGGEGARQRGEGAEETLDPSVDTWLGDHRPTWTLPALPMMSMVDRLAGALARSGAMVTGLSEVQVHRWLPFPGTPVRLRTEVKDGGEVTLSAFREAREAALSRFEPVASGRVLTNTRYPSAPAPWTPLADAVPAEDPYRSAALFHGPAFQMLRSWSIGPSGSSGLVDLSLRGVPRGTLHQGLLDALTHAIPHDALSQWSPDISDDVVGYPYRIPSLTLHGEIPSSGEGRVEVRFAGFDGEPRFPKYDIQLIVDGAVLVALTLVEVLLPKGPIGRATRLERRAFLRDRRFVPGVRLARVEGASTVAAPSDVKPSDWLPGNVATIYGVPPGRELVAEVAVRDHLAARAIVHPSSVRPADDLRSATVAMRPLRRHFLDVAREGDAVRVTDAAAPALDLAPVESYWRDRFAIGPWPVEDLYYGLIERFIGDVVIADPEAFARVRGRSCLYLANHQVAVESLLFSVIASGLSEVATVTLAKAEHRGTWVGELIRHSFSYPGITDPNLITFFDRDDRESLVRIIGELAQEMAQRGKSVMVHVEGTRGLSCRQPVMKMSSAFIDMAFAVGAPIVPVRFSGALPAEELSQRLEFPLGYGRQDIWIGRPIEPEALASLPLKERKQVVIDAINGLGAPPSEERPTAPDPAFARRVEAWTARCGGTPEHAVLMATLDSLTAFRSEATRRFVAGAREDAIVTGEGPAGEWLAGFATWLFGGRSNTEGMTR
jgi:acyl transferase domain-containing protein/3-hydroxymyristoyl/3-hydroxydecanoyl-(acyl carrier protein) dehydratase/1-acyl-sn-glycerol-3-phosphate acyltransferase